VGVGLLQCHNRQRSGKNKTLKKHFKKNKKNEIGLRNIFQNP
jgi:hypothetical protein